jgi:AbrB family looped-hinge helix DNA binding protein
MKIAQSRVTSQSQISVPAKVRERLGVGPGSVLEWSEEDGEVVIRRAGRFTVADLHTALFPDGPPSEIADVKDAIRERTRRRHARD